MISFIIIIRALVPLIEGLCAWILDFRFEIIGGLRSHLLLFFFGRKNILKKKAVSVQDLIPPPSMYIHMCTLYTYTNIYMSRFSPSGFFGPSRCLIPTAELTSEYPICAVCVRVCVYTHIHKHTLPPALKIEKTQTTPLSFLLSSITPYTKQQMLLLTSWTPPSSFPQRWTNKLHFHKRICTSCSERVSKCVRWCSQHPSNVHTCTCMVPKILV